MSPRRAANGNGSGLTERQNEVLRLLLAGKMQKHIGLELRIAASTVGTYLMAIKRKFGVRTVRELFALSAGTLNTSAELARLRAEVASLEKWRQVMNREINLVTAQRDAAMKELEECRKAKR